MPENIEREIYDIERMIDREQNRVTPNKSRIRRLECHLENLYEDLSDSQIPMYM